MNPDDWRTRVTTALAELSLAMVPIGKVLAAPSWNMCPVHCRSLMRISSTAAELLVKAAMERRGVAADHTHDIGRQEVASVVVDGRQQIEKALTGFFDQMQRYAPSPPTAPEPVEEPDPGQGIMPDPFEPPSPFDY